MEQARDEQRGADARVGEPGSGCAMAGREQEQGEDKQREMSVVGLHSTRTPGKKTRPDAMAGHREDERAEGRRPGSSGRQRSMARAQSTEAGRSHGLGDGLGTRELRAGTPRSERRKPGGARDAESSAGRRTRARARELGTARHAGEGIRRRELGAQSTMAVRGERARSLGGLGNDQGARDSVEKQDRCRAQGMVGPSGRAPATREEDARE